MKKMSPRKGSARITHFGAGQEKSEKTSRLDRLFVTKKMQSILPRREKRSEDMKANSLAKKLSISITICLIAILATVADVANGQFMNIYQQDFETGLAGYTINNDYEDANGLWHLTDQCEAIEPGHSPSHALYYGIDATCNYDPNLYYDPNMYLYNMEPEGGIPTAGVALSPIIDLTGAQGDVILQFNYFLHTEEFPFEFDQAYVEVSVNDGPFQILATNNPDQVTFGQQELLRDPTDGWESQMVKIPDAAGANIQLRFRFQTGDGIANDYPGFYIDDIELAQTEGFIYILGDPCETIYMKIQEAIDDCPPGGTVIVTRGTYTGPGNRDLDFRGKAITVRGTDSGNCEDIIIDCQGTLSDPHRGFIFNNGEGPDSILQGLVIYGGSGPFELIDGSLISVGGGIFCDGASPQIIDCCIVQCRSNARGGGVFNYNNANPDYRYCHFIANGATFGGAMSNLNSDPAIYDCKFFENDTAHGGGIYNDQSQPTVKLSRFGYNSSSRGGGMANVNGSNPYVWNCTFDYNSSGSRAGAIWNDASEPNMVNCTMTRNDAYRGGGIYNENGATAWLTNCIVGKNGQEIGIEGLDIYNASGSTAVLDHCDTSNEINMPPGFGGEPSLDAGGNIAQEPLFVPGPLGNYYLWHIDAGQAENSPCLDAGNTTPAELGMGELTSRVDSMPDIAIVDIGRHYLQQAYLMLTSPRAGDRIPEGMPHEIKWQSGNGQWIPAVRIYLKIKVGEGWGDWVEIDPYVIKESNGSYWWAVPAGLDLQYEGAEIKIVSAIDGTIIDYSGPFTIFSCEGQMPREPYPQDDGEPNVPGDVILSWNNNDVDCTTTFDVYLGTDSESLELICQGTNEKQCDPTVNGATLDCDTTYYWQVSAHNCCMGVEDPTFGPVWSFTTAPLMADINGDCAVDILDLQIMANYWLIDQCDNMPSSGPADCGFADLDGLGTVGLGDFAILAENWGACARSDGCP